MTTLNKRITPRPRAEPRLELVEMCWRMQSVHRPTRTLDCSIYRTDVGLELRAGYGVDDPVRTQQFRDSTTGTTDAIRFRTAQARRLAEQWRTKALATAGFEELPLSGPPNDGALRRRSMNQTRSMVMNNTTLDRASLPEEAPLGATGPTIASARASPGMVCGKP
jgi:hypothetical protein